jgi:hypothetical protein
MLKWLLFSALLGALLLTSKISFLSLNLFRPASFYLDSCKADDDTETSTPVPPRVDNDIGKHADGSKTDDEVVQK